ncbi:hypothetical protein GQ607_012549 [Colletotrichum asianum]|uniref:Uncharacterized protein n=1 Tax=Colletotrichum asianum TaxID=702518 RepID=A0A8H3ZLS8_9PEZI|nr:hypothetical protein GQ607_012549 [Colletotrichum asianum]
MIFCEEELCEENDFTEDEYAYEVDEYGEHEYKKDDRADQREDEPDEDEQQEEDRRDDKQDETLNENEAENKLQKDEENQENESEDDDHKEQHLGINIPSELAYDRTQTFAVPVAVREVFQNSDYVDFWDSVDAAPGLWYFE